VAGDRDGDHQIDPGQPGESGVWPVTVDRRPVPPRRFGSLVRQPLIVGQRRLRWRYNSARIACVATTNVRDPQSLSTRGLSCACSSPATRGTALVALQRCAGHGVVGLDPGLFADHSRPLALRHLEEA
jgi:hypothetical protein